MPQSRADRRARREQRAVTDFGAHAVAALDLLELVEFAWHDCYGEVSPPDEVVADIFDCAGGDLDTLARAARLAVHDSRDLRMWADDCRRRR